MLPPLCGTGDRPIEITLRRAWQALSWRRRFELAGQLLQGVLLQGQVRTVFNAHDLHIPPFTGLCGVTGPLCQILEWQFYSWPDSQM